MVYGIGGVPHACTAWIVEGKHNPCPEQGSPFNDATGFKNPYASINPLFGYHRYMVAQYHIHQSMGCQNYEAF